MTLARELKIAMELVEAAGPLALRWQQSGALNTQRKPGGEGPVTEADHEINARLVAGLAEAFPADDILAEESLRRHDPTTPAPRRWFVDPIDGTREYARGGDSWSVLIGLAIDDAPALGVVAEPSMGRVTWATGPPPASGVRTEDGEQPLHRTRHDEPSLVVSGGRNYPLSRFRAIRKALAPAQPLYAGSVGVRMAAVARGHADVCVQPPGRTKQWDTCAPSVLVRAVGGTVTDMLGAPLHYGVELGHAHGVVATAGVDHREILARLAPLRARWGIVEVS